LVVGIAMMAGPTARAQRRVVMMNLIVGGDFVLEWVVR
jgi:hypothetical protein